VANNELRIKILVDNRVEDGLIEEHGFSVWIEVDGHKILFDTGQGQALLPNAARLGCELSELDALILSHGHFDHCGAISGLIEINPKIHVYAHTNLFAPRYSIKPDQPARNIAVPQQEREALLDLPDSQLHWIDGPQEVLAGVCVTGAIDRHNNLEDTGGPFFLDLTRQIPDLIKDDMSVWFKTGRGLVIITGCCHSGLINTVEHIRSVSGVERVRGIVGGLHLLNASCERINSTIDILSEWNPEFVVPCHCTGEEVSVAPRTCKLPAGLKMQSTKNRRPLILSRSAI